MEAIIELLASRHGVVAELLVGLGLFVWRARHNSDEDAPALGRLAVAAVLGTSGLVATTVATAAAATVLARLV